MPRLLPALRLLLTPAAQGQVGNGEFWTLADRALLAAGAQRPGRGGLGLYELGRRLPPHGEILPGDVIQFEGVVFVSRAEGRRIQMLYAHHTAVLASVGGARLGILHQNDGGRKRVKFGFIDLAARTKGEIAFYRPLVGPPSTVEHPQG